MNILVTGGTGRVGTEVVKQLQSRGAQVRVLSRSKDAAAKFQNKVEIAAGEMLDPKSLAGALTGVDKLFLLNAVAADELTQAIIAFDLARKHQLKQVVYLSVFEAHRFTDVPHFVSKLGVEAALKQFDVPFTILRPNYFMQNDAMLKAPLQGPGIYPTPLGTRGVSAVDVRDIAEAAAIALTTDGHQGRTYNLVGPDVLTGPTAAAIWTKVLNKKVRYTAGSLDTWQDEMEKQMPGWLAFELRMMFQAYQERGFAANEGDVETLTGLLGHAPRRYEDLAMQTATGWAKN